MKRRFAGSAGKRLGCFHASPELRELRPGQVILTRPASALRLAYGRRSAVGRWTPLRCEEKDYRVTVALRGPNDLDPPHLPCYASAAIRKKCWQGVAASGAVAARLNGLQQRQSVKSGSGKK